MWIDMLKRILTVLGVRSVDYIVEPAVNGMALAREIREFFHENPEQGIRQLSVDEVEQLTNDDLFYVARAGGDRAIVGTLYFQADSAYRWELGGALVAAKHRKSGIFACLGVVSLVAQYLQDREAAKRVGTKKMVGRVLKGNRYPINSLQRLHFNFVGEIEIDPRGKRGLQEMPTNSRGMVEALDFVFDESFLVECVKQAMKYRDNGTLVSMKTVRIAIPYLLAEGGRDPLKEFLAEFGG
jgi:hypothetical protein